MAVPPDVQAALDRLSGGYNNGDYNASSNPLGFSNGGHRINLYALTADVTLVGEWLHDQVTPVVDMSAEIQALAAIVPQVETLAALDAEVAALAAIDEQLITLAGIAASIVTVAGIAADVETVADISAAVTTVAARDADVATVAARDADIATLADIEDGTDATGAITTVASIATAVTTVAADQADVGAVAGSIGAVNAVAANNANVTIVAGIDAEVATVAAIAASVAAVATNEENIDTVAGNLAAVNVVAAADADIAAVAGDIAAVALVAANEGSIDIVAANAAEVASVATNMSAVLAAEGYAAAAEAGVRPYVFAASTADANPGAGVLRLNNANPSLATMIFVSVSDAVGVDQAAWIEAMDDSTTVANRGRFTLTGTDDRSVQALFRVIGAVVTGAGYRKIPVQFMSLAGALADGAVYAASFERTGDKGIDGLGAGDVIGPSEAPEGDVALFDGVTGKAIKAGGALHTVAFSGAYGDLAGTPTLGTAAAANAADFADAGQGEKADSAVQPDLLAEAVASVRAYARRFSLWTGY